MFDIPIVLFIFKRKSTLSKIVSKIAEVKPKKLYIIADGGRNQAETKEVNECRALVESLINWDCEIIKNYAEDNRGVYKNIGEGASWVFGREEKAIFIEDDNLPETSFFHYAKELLEKYENEESVLWVCGTNYFTETESEYSYYFTKHLLPCGWASWSKKFLKYYDGELKSFKNLKKRIAFLKNYRYKFLGFYQLQSIKNEYFRKKRGDRFRSWDFQMIWSIQSNGLFGIAPTRNQITNIGVDDLSIHGGTSKNNIMTDRFCEVESKALDFPLKHPKKIEINKTFEKRLGNIICPPKKAAIRKIISSKIKHLFGVDSSNLLKSVLQKREQ